jgi:hypothetical protein
MLITRKSAISGINRTIDIPVNPEDYTIFMEGYASIDETMPYLSAEHRDFILSGITSDEWKSAFITENSE